jgi:hypothetical protein
MRGIGGSERIASPKQPNVFAWAEAAFGPWEGSRWPILPGADRLAEEFPRPPLPRRGFPIKQVNSL